MDHGNAVKSVLTGHYSEIVYLTDAICKWCSSVIVMYKNKWELYCFRPSMLINYIIETRYEAWWSMMTSKHYIHILAWGEPMTPWLSCYVFLVLSTGRDDRITTVFVAVFAANFVAVFVVVFVVVLCCIKCVISTHTRKWFIIMITDSSSHLQSEIIHRQRLQWHAQ